MTAKTPTPMPENIQRPKAPGAPPKLHNIVSVDIKIYERSKYPVYAFDMWMWFEAREAYLDWMDMIIKTRSLCSCGDCPSGTPRQKSKCVKENGLKSGKMCLREDEND